MKRILILIVLLFTSGCAGVSKKDMKELDAYAGASFNGKFTMTKYSSLKAKMELIALTPEDAETEDFIEVETGLRDLLNYIRAYRRDIANYEVNIEEIIEQRIETYK